MRRLTTTGFALTLLALACGKTGAHGADELNPATAGSGSGSVGGAGGETSVEVPSACLGLEPSPGPAPLSALSNYELNRSIRALLPDAPELDTAPWLDDNERSVPFARPSQGPQLREFHELAHAVALRLSRAPAAIRALSDCDPAVSGEETCAPKFVQAFLTRAYRRAVNAEDKQEMAAVFAEGQRLGGDFASGVRAVVEVALQSPDFMYLLELGGDQNTGDSVALTGYESAARLAYFLTGAPPDDQLLATAAKGSFEPETLESEARRLLGSPASRQLLRHFYSGLLELTFMENAKLGYTAPIAELAVEQTGRFAEDVTFDGAGTFRALLTEPSAWVNEPLANFYGFPGVTGEAFQKIELDPKQRAGIFTQAAFLAATSRTTEPSPIRRGMSILTNLLCYDIPPPPPDVLFTPPDVLPPTMRGLLELLTADPTCQSCHKDLNPAGFAFQHYDSVGKWRDTENGVPVDASGALYKTDAAGKFADAVELMQHIAESSDAKRCFAGHWLTQAYRRPGEAADACAQEQVSQAFADSDGNLVELMLALAKSDHFRFRLKSELKP